jgi:hypothetical protein
LVELVVCGGFAQKLVVHGEKYNYSKKYLILCFTTPKSNSGSFMSLFVITPTPF